MSKVSVNQFSHNSYEIAQKAIDLRSSIKPREDLKPTPLLQGAAPSIQKVFSPILGKKMNLNFKNRDYEVQDYGDFIIFHPQEVSEATPKARLFFHSFSEDQMKKFPNFNKNHHGDYRDYYKSCLKLMDAQNLIPVKPTQDLIWHRGYWGNASEHGLKIGTTSRSNSLPLPLRLFSMVQDLLSSKKVLKHFGKEQFITDPFSKSAAHSLLTLAQRYPRLKVIAHSMGNATLLEALDILKRNNLSLPHNDTTTVLLTHPVYQIKDFVAGSGSHLAIENARRDFAEYLYDLLNPLTKYDGKFTEKMFISPSWIFEMLDSAKKKNNLTSKQFDKLSEVIRATHEQINHNNFSYKKFNDTVKEIFPLVDKKKLRDKPTVHFYLKRYMSRGLSGIMQNYIGKKYANQINDELLATQPFCIIPFENGYGGRLMNEFFGERSWKVISGQKDFVAPNPEIFVPNVFNIPPEKIEQVDSRVIPYNELKKLKDKQLILLTQGSHSSPVIGKSTVIW